MKDADAAKELLKAYEAAETDDPGVKEWRAACKAVREGEDVIITGKATPSIGRTASLHAEQITAVRVTGRKCRWSRQARP